MSTKAKWSVKLAAASIASLAYCLLHLRIQHSWPFDINKIHNTKPNVNLRWSQKRFCFIQYVSMYTYSIRREDSP